MAVSASRERWRQVQRLFADVVGLDPARREARLERACRDDPRLREEVEALLDRHERGEAVGPKHGLTRPPQPPERLPAVTPMSSSEGEPELFAGRYRLIEELGRGAMGVVYRARDTRLDRFVAVKVLAPHLAADGQARARLLAEANAVAALDHPNLCTIYEAGESDDGRLFLAMACYEGETLEAVLARGPLPVAEAVRIARDIARGLGVAHRHGVVHRDVKPSNVLVTDEGVTKLLDFGIAKVMDSGLTRTGDTLGTVAYMSPEQLRGRVDARTDLWALGVMLYEMLTGTRPFRGDYEAALLYAIVHEEPTPVKTQRPDVPEALAEVVRHCMEKDPEARYQSAEEVASALEPAPGGAREATPAGRPSRRRWAVPALGMTVVLTALLVPQVRTPATELLGLGGETEVLHLAVLPLASSGGQAAVGDGLTLTLTSLLGQLGPQAAPAFTVIPASEMSAITTAEEARGRFGVEQVVTGEFRQEGGEVQLTLNLVDARTLRRIRTERITEPASRLPVLERRALAVLADLFGVPLGEEQEAMLTAGSTADPMAYEFYLQGRAALSRFDKSENVSTAMQFFEWALAEDSAYALAYAGLSEASRLRYLETRDPAWVGRAEAYSARALALDDRLTLVRITLGRLYALNGAREKAIEEFRLALALDPRSAEAHDGLAQALRAVGRSEEAEEHYRQAIALQPGTWTFHNHLGEFYLHEARLEEAAKQFRQVIATAPRHLWGYSNLGAVYLYMGRYEAAREVLERANEIQPTSSVLSNLGAATYFLYEGRRPDEEVRLYEQALRLDSADYVLWGNLASAYRRMPDKRDRADQAFRHAASLVEQRLEVSPEAAGLLSDLAEYAAQIGDQEKARTALVQALAVARNDVLVQHRAARVYELLGDRAEALRWLGTAIENGYPLDDIESDPDLEALRRDPAYSTLASTGDSE